MNTKSIAQQLVDEGYSNAANSNSDEYVGVSVRIDMLYPMIIDEIASKFGTSRNILLRELMTEHIYHLMVAFLNHDKEVCLDIVRQFYHQSSNDNNGVLHRLIEEDWISYDDVNSIKAVP
jgi:hypothetical protein